MRPGPRATRPRVNPGSTLGRGREPLLLKVRPHAGQVVGKLGALSLGQSPNASVPCCTSTGRTDRNGVIAGRDRGIVGHDHFPGRSGCASIDSISRLGIAASSRSTPRLASDGSVSHVLWALMALGHVAGHEGVVERVALRRAGVARAHSPHSLASLSTSTRISITTARRISSRCSGSESCSVYRSQSFDSSLSRSTG
jgi:hypothetical protein